MQVTKFFPEYLLWGKKQNLVVFKEVETALIKCKDEVKKSVQSKNLKFKERIGNYSSS